MRSDPAQEKCGPDMTLRVYRGRKTTMQQQQLLKASLNSKEFKRSKLFSASDRIMILCKQICGQVGINLLSKGCLLDS